LIGEMYSAVLHVTGFRRVDHESNATGLMVSRPDQTIPALCTPQEWFPAIHTLRSLEPQRSRLTGQVLGR
jgi:hypothetical protein